MGNYYSMDSSALRKFYKGKNILITGHSGFKGSWLCRWLELLGSRVSGMSLRPETNPSHFEVLYKNGRQSDYWQDIRLKNKVKEIFDKVNPEIVFHLAAQPSVIESYRNPLETIETNIVGSGNILKAAYENPYTQIVIVITTDKCYENKEWLYPYRENDELGGHDIYSSSKACVELLTRAWQRSFCSLKENGTAIASARAGNVIGGGDWTADRLVVDLIKSRYTGSELQIRSPESTRPWQHVLEPLSGYLQLAMKISADKTLASSYNFGPDISSNLSTLELINLFASIDKKYPRNPRKNNPEFHEASLLMVDSSKAKAILNWKPIFNVQDSVKLTETWYKNFYQKNRLITDEQIDLYMQRIPNVH